MRTTLPFAACTALLAGLITVAPALARDYGPDQDRDAWRSLQDKLESGVEFSDLADFEKVQILYQAEDRAHTDDPEAVFEEACTIYVELRYGSKMDRFRDTMDREDAYENMVADVYARNEIAELLDLDYFEELPEPED